MSFVQFQNGCTVASVPERFFGQLEERHRTISDCRCLINVLDEYITFDGWNVTTNCPFADRRYVCGKGTDHLFFCPSSGGGVFLRRGVDFLPDCSARGFRSSNYQRLLSLTEARKFIAKSDEWSRC